MYLAHRKNGNELIIELEGEIGNFEAKKILEDIDKLLELYKKENILVDLKKVSFMDSSGIAIIMKIYKEVNKSRKFQVKNAPNLAMKIFRASGVIKFVDFV